MPGSREEFCQPCSLAGNGQGVRSYVSAVRRRTFRTVHTDNGWRNALFHNHFPNWVSLAQILLSQNNS